MDCDHKEIAKYLEDQAEDELLTGTECKEVFLDYLPLWYSLLSWVDQMWAKVGSLMPLWARG